MAMIRALFDKNIFSRNEELGQMPLTSVAMQRAISEWFELYFMRSSTQEKDPCQRLPYAIVHKLSKATFSEYSCEITSVEKTKKFEWQGKNLVALSKVKQKAMQWTLIGGECLLKPIITDSQFTFQVINRLQYDVLARDIQGKITCVATSEKFEENKRFYTLIEKRTLLPTGQLTIENRLYESTNSYTLGVYTKLNSVARCANLVVTYTTKNPTNSIWMINLKLPIVNSVDGSFDGCSIYEPAVELINNIYRNEKQLDDEFDNGRSRIFASGDILKRDAYGKKIVRDKVFTALDDNASSVGITAYSPVLRNESFESRKQSYLKACENVIGLKRGILSDVETAQRTATEITSSEGDFALTIQDLQTMWYDVVKETLQLCEQIGNDYKICDETVFDYEALSMQWGNGVLYDAGQEWQDRLLMVQSGLLKPELALGWKYDLPCTSEKDLAFIRKKYMPEIVGIE